MNKNIEEENKSFLEQFLFFWRKIYPKPIQFIFLLVFLYGIYVIYLNFSYGAGNIEDAKIFFNLLIILILLVLMPPFLKTSVFYTRELILPMTIFQKCLIGLIFCILIVLIFILMKVV